MLDPDWAPSPSDVGAVLRSRTKDTNGNELGTFTNDTRPTDSQVIELIETTVSDLSSDVGSVPDELQDAARRLSAIGAAMLVELSYFSEQIVTDRSPYDRLKELYDARFARLKAQIEDVNAGGEVGGGEEAEALLPAYSFPAVCNPLGLETRW
jgi:hypothetical protein